MGKQVKEIDRKQRKLSALIDDVKARKEDLDKAIARTMADDTYETDASVDGDVQASANELDNALETLSRELAAMLPPGKPQIYTGC